MATERAIRIDYVPLSELRAWPRNPKEHDLGVIHSSIARFGFVTPIIINEATGMILAGHGRLDTLLQRQASGEPLPQGLRAENGQWLVPVIRGVSLPSEEAEAYAIADNRLVELGGWDDARLAEVLRDLVATPESLAGVGYDGDDLDALLKSLGMLEPDTREDDPEVVSKSDELQEKWRVERGQVWLCGPHRVMCGDSTSEADVAMLMQGHVARLLVTDPPYGVNYQTDGKHPTWRSDHAPIANDNLGADQPAFWRDSLRYWPLDGDAYVFAPAGPLMSSLGAAVGESGIDHHQWLVWAKDRFSLGRSHYHYRHEHIFYGWRGNSSWNGSRTEDSVWECQRPNASPEHPTMKPVELCERAIENSSKTGDIVVDPFLGSGTTLIAAEKLGRVCYGMEIHPPYCAVTLQRYLDFTGNMPRQAN